MLTESAEHIGVASERSGGGLARASDRGQAGNGSQALCSEDSAVGWVDESGAQRLKLTIG